MSPEQCPGPTQRHRQPATRPASPYLGTLPCPHRRVIDIEVVCAVHVYPLRRAATTMHLAAKRGSMHLRLPVVGDVDLPPMSDVAFYGRVVAVAAVGLVEWP